MCHGHTKHDYGRTSARVEAYFSACEFEEHLDQMEMDSEGRKITPALWTHLYKSLPHHPLPKQRHRGLYLVDAKVIAH